MNHLPECTKRTESKPHVIVNFLEAYGHSDSFLSYSQAM